MVNRISTATLSDLTSIFDPDVQELEDVGDARILYTFDAEGASQRQRVGSEFILDVSEPPVSFFVSAPLDAQIGEGKIILAQSLPDVPQEFMLSEVDDVVKYVSIALGEGDDESIATILTQ